MKYFREGNRRKVREYWRKLMCSTQNKFSRGASNIIKIVSWARSENWRRDDKKNMKR